MVIMKRYFDLISGSHHIVGYNRLSHRMDLAQSAIIKKRRLSSSADVERGVLDSVVLSSRFYSW